MHVIGKVPGLPEFVSQRAFGPPLEPLERWIEDGVGYCHVELRDALETEFDGAMPYSFVWQARDDRPVAGTIFPSHDSVGRRFPLVVCEAFDLPSFCMQLAPVALGDYLEDIFVAAKDVLALADRAAIALRVKTVRMPTSDNFAAARDEYAAWADETPLCVAWARFVDGDAPETAGPARAEAALSALRRHGFVRIPLGRGAAGAASFWLQLIERAMARPMAAFWAVDGSSMLVCTGVPTPRGFASLFLPIDDAEPDDATVSSQRSSTLGLEEGDAPVSRAMENLGRTVATT